MTPGSEQFSIIKVGLISAVPQVSEISPSSIIGTTNSPAIALRFSLKILCAFSTFKSTACAALFLFIACKWIFVKQKTNSTVSSFLTLRLKYVRGKCFFFITLLKR